MASKDRIGDKCWYFAFSEERQQTSWFSGVVRSWSVRGGIEDGEGTVYPVCIVEDVETGRCASVSVMNISFAKENPDKPGQTHLARAMER